MQTSNKSGTKRACICRLIFTKKSCLLRTFRRHNAGKKQANPKMPKNGTFGVLENGENGVITGYATIALAIVVDVYLVDVK